MLTQLSAKRWACTRPRSTRAGIRSRRSRGWSAGLAHRASSSSSRPCRTRRCPCSPAHGRDARGRGRPLGLFVEGDTRWCSSTAITPKAPASSSGTSMQATLSSRAAAGMLGEHDLVVHLVDMVAGQHQHVAGVGFAQQVQVLPHGVGGAAVPASPPAAGPGHVDVLAQVAGQEVPSRVRRGGSGSAPCTASARRCAGCRS
jgi:hypothetical protein